MKRWIASPRGQLASIAIAVFALDQLSKYWLLEVFQIAARTPVRLCDNFSLVMAWNRGVSFSMLSTHATWMPWILIALALGVSALLVRLALNTPHRLERIGYACVIGGALGNALDRARFGAVADFFYAHIGDLGWPAFNVADMTICTGVGLLLIAMMKKPAAS